MFPQNRVMWSHRSSGISHKAKRYAAFLATNPGVKEALEIDHKISRDLADKLATYGSISPAQVALAFKLHADAWTPARPYETHAAAPEGRQTFRGTVVSLKQHDGQFGVCWKMTIKVTAPAGVWLAWGTVPSGLNPSKGDVVELTATLTRGNESHFAFAKRPANARVIDVDAAELATRANAAAVRELDALSGRVDPVIAAHVRARLTTPAPAPVAPAPEHRNAAALRELDRLEAQGADPAIVAQARAVLSRP